MVELWLTQVLATQLFNLMTDKEIQSFREEQFWALFSPNGQSLVVQGQDGMKIVR
jgi:WD40 repeat protein